MIFRYDARKVLKSQFPQILPLEVPLPLKLKITIILDTLTRFKDISASYVSRKLRVYNRASNYNLDFANVQKH
jgi:hypothetical protein